MLLSFAEPQPVVVSLNRINQTVWGLIGNLGVLRSPPLILLWWLFWVEQSATKVVTFVAKIGQRFKQNEEVALKKPEITLCDE